MLVLMMDSIGFNSLLPLKLMQMVLSLKTMASFFCWLWRNATKESGKGKLCCLSAVVVIGALDGSTYSTVLFAVSNPQLDPLLFEPANALFLVI